MIHNLPIPGTIASAVVFFASMAAVCPAANLVTNGGFANTGTQTSSYAIQSSNSNGGTALLPGWTVAPYPNPSNPLDCLMYSGQTTGLCGGGNVGPGGPNNPSGQWEFYTYPGASPNGGNFFGADGDSTIHSALSQVINGLNVGDTYTLSFYQAAAQQQGFAGQTTEQWQVSLGTQTQDSLLMNTPSQGTTAWNAQSLTFTATSTSETLSFLALGTPNSFSPFVLLDGVDLEDTTTTTPEPMTAGLLLIGGLIFVPVVNRLRRKTS
jgi:hypothetical protein